MSQKINEESCSNLIKKKVDSCRSLIEKENYSLVLMNYERIDYSKISILSNKNHLQICKECNLNFLHKVENRSISKCK